MPSAIETPFATNPPNKRSLRDGFERWNRKLHIYAGLFFLFFMWLFAFTGLILNHPTWTFAESWNNRKETNYVREILVPGLEVKGDLAQAKEIMKQLGIEGDILWTAIRTDPNQFVFQVRRPGHFFFLNADYLKKSASVRQVDVNLWGVTKVLHTFTGASIDDPRNTRDWKLTYLWVFCMDALAVGLILMLLSSLFMWFRLRPKRIPGAIALALGCLTCGLFCIGLKWIF
ncbi:MAG: PepSY-associated helix domain protein [Verrucomicrobiales bacterium]|jgi:hypothetical protein|nr:PepSY-associated helix domain protein [Verrucomicrobiales bacterium]